jgi:glutamate-1-semialdehyde aminotransferase
VSFSQRIIRIQRAWTKRNVTIQFRKFHFFTNMVCPIQHQMADSYFQKYGRKVPAELDQIVRGLSPNNQEMLRRLFDRFWQRQQVQGMIKFTLWHLKFKIMHPKKVSLH